MQKRTNTLITIALTILLGAVSHPLLAQEDKVSGFAMNAEQKFKSDAEQEKKAAVWVSSLGLNDVAKEERVKAAIALHLRAVREWHNDHPYTTVPAGINPATGNPLSQLDRQLIANSAIPRSVHENLMTALHKDLNEEQVEQVLDMYTIGKVAFTMAGYKAIVPDLTAEEEARILSFLKQAREQAIDYKNINQISAIFEIYKTKSEQYLNANGRNWRALYKAYTDAAKASKAAAQQSKTDKADLPVQAAKWKKGILVDEFIYEKAPFPQCHSATIVETPAGLVTAFFGGTRERNPDVCIYVSRQVNGKWTTPKNVADGVMPDKRYPTWNPVLYQVPNGKLLLFYKIGPSPAEWKGWMRTSNDHGKTWSKAKALPSGYIGPVKNKPVLLSNGNLICPTSTEGNKVGNSWQIHFEVTPDFGRTWSKVGPVNAGKDVDAIQPSVLDHGNGKLQILARSRNRAILESWSENGGKTWSALAKTSLPNNNSGTDAVTLKDGRHALVYNHVLPPG
ncbi:MAG TPA: exo-alpha-sialidase, partial [Chitinophagaceae bacterium]